MTVIMKKAIGSYGNFTLKVSWQVWGLPVSLGFDKTFIGIRMFCFGILFERRRNGTD